MELSSKLPRPRGDRLVLYAVTREDQKADADADLKVMDGGYVRRTVIGWWDNRLPYEGNLPDLTEPTHVSGQQLVKALQTHYPDVTVTLRFGPRAAWIAKQERRRAAWDEAKTKRPELPQEMKRLIHALSPECMICHTTARKLQIAHILGWPAIRRLVETHPLWMRDDHGLRRAALMFHDPWNMGILCRDHAHRSGCHDRQEAGEITLEQLRHAREGLDRQPGADRLYRRYLDQSLIEQRRSIGLDLNVMVRVLRLLSKAAKPGETSPYVLLHGMIKVDRAEGSLQWGQYDCPDESHGEIAKGI